MGAGSSAVAAAQAVATDATNEEFASFAAALPPDSKDKLNNALAALLAEDNNVNGEAYAFLEKVNLFKRLPKAEFPALLRACEDVEFEPGAIIVNQGDEGHEFFIIKSGTAKVEVNGNMVATLKPGSYFGENALLHNDPRNASIVCQAKINALKISREQFKALGLNEKLDFARRGAVACGAVADAEIKPPAKKTPAEMSRIAEAMKSNAGLANMITLDDIKLNAMIEIMWKEDVPKGTEVIKEGDQDANYFYVVNSGNFEVTKVPEGGSAEDQIGQSGSEASLGPGTSFGELALLYFAPRAATVTATTGASVFVIARQQFKDIITAAQADLAGTYIKYLNKVPTLEPLMDTEKKQMAEALTDFVFEEGEIIFEQGEKGVLFYILIDGQVSVIKDGKEETKLTATQDDAPFFGELALLKNEPRVATIKVISSTATTLSMDKVSFEMLLGTLEDLKKRGKDGSGKVTKRQTVVALPEATSRFNQIKLNDLKRLGLLGCGGFGAVEMVEHRNTGECYALKALSKGFVLKAGMQNNIMSEKDVQLLCDSTFVIKLYETYNGEQSLYLLLELALGGELYATYNKRSMWGNVECAKFYIAGTIFAFDHLHSRKIIYRDLKPENLLLNEHGKVKLTDMGLAKVVVGKTFTTCGTPVYFAPELIGSKGHTEAVDWWTLGILNFELLAGHPPFDAPSPPQIYQKIMKGIMKVKFPDACKSTVETLIKGNCLANPALRLPVKRGGSDNVKKHEWYAGFDWKAFENLTMEVPYQPRIKNKKDMRNFTATADDMPPQIPYKDPGTGWDKDFATSS